jgi:hypothetical protein
MAAIARSPRAPLLAVAGIGQVALFDDAGNLLCVHDSDMQRIGSVSFSHDGALLAFAGGTAGRSADEQFEELERISGSSLEKAWLDFASSVHGVNGLLKDLRHRPARAHGHLNTNGVLILAALSNTTIPIRVKELEIYFQSLMSPKTVKSYLKKLVSKGLIAKDSKGYSLVSDFEAQLNSYETIETTCAQRKQRITTTTHSETRTFHQQQNPDGILSERSKRTWRWGYTDTSNATIVGCRG